MSVLRRLSQMKQLLIQSTKQNFDALSVTPFCHNLIVIPSNKYDDGVYFSNHLVSTKQNFHTTVIKRDIEAGLKGVGAGLGMIGGVGSGIGIGLVFGHFMASIARNPSTKEDLFPLAIMGAVFCETICLFCFLISVMILFL